MVHPPQVTATLGIVTVAENEPLPSEPPKVTDPGLVIMVGANERPASVHVQLVSAGEAVIVEPEMVPVRLNLAQLYVAFFDGIVEDAVPD